ncbi:MAG: hypothetical protein ACAF41_16965 [Leptolyngbya sp. BL-A-14]
MLETIAGRSLPVAATHYRCDVVVASTATPTINIDFGFATTRSSRRYFGSRA